MQAGPQQQAKTGIAACRGITSVIVSFLTFVAILSADIGISVDYGNILMSDKECSLKAAFGLFVVASCAILFLFIWDCVNLCIMFYTDGCCRCECYHLNISLQTASFGMILIGTIIYGSKNPDKVGWAFWFALAAAIMALINGMMWCMTQHIARSITAKTSGFGKVGGGLGVD